MQMGMIGLGRMGANIVRRLMKDGHECVVYNRSRAPVDALVDEGATGAYSLEELTERLRSPRPVWLMLPAGVTGTIIEQLTPHLAAGDIVIDGGNSHYHDDIARAAFLSAAGIHYVDCGTSGGVWGLERGYCLMIGGDEQTVRHLDPLFRSIAPGVDAAARTSGRTGEPSSAERGYLLCGPAGAGHFVKMVHNGIEYGLMAAYAEGLNILANADVGNPQHEVDAETAPLEHPEHYRYDIDVSEVAEVWRRGSVVASWLLDLTAAALAEDPNLDAFEGRVSDSGEARWTLQAAIDEGVPVHVIGAALFNRFSSRGLDDFANRVMSAMRKEFGGHDERA